MCVKLHYDQSPKVKIRYKRVERGDSRALGMHVHMQLCVKQTEENKVIDCVEKKTRNCHTCV